MDDYSQGKVNGSHACSRCPSHLPSHDTLLHGSDKSMKSSSYDEVPKIRSSHAYSLCKPRPKRMQYHYGLLSKPSTLWLEILKHAISDDFLAFDGCGFTSTTIDIAKA